MSNNWRDKLKIALSENPKLTTVEFLNKHINEIEGSTRDSKYKKVKRIIEKFQFTGEINTGTSEQIFENISNPNIININAKKKLVFGVIGDTHIGSKYTQLTYLHQFYNLCKQEGVKSVYHTGDISEGEQMRLGHNYDNYVQGADEYIQEIIKNYPKVDGITTHFITGNHDASFRKLCGLDIGYNIADKRSDLHYLGRDFAVVNITPKVSMMLRHPWDGTAYALSYKIQKMVESMDENIRPNIMCVGHYHKIEYLYYLGVHCLQTGCFQSATPYTIGKGIRVSIGGWIVEIELDKDGELLTLTPKAVTFKSPIKEDYKNFSR